VKEVEREEGRGKGRECRGRKRRGILAPTFYDLPAPLLN